MGPSEVRTEGRHQQEEGPELIVRVGLPGGSSKSLGGESSIEASSELGPLMHSLMGVGQADQGGQGTWCHLLPRLGPE